MTIRIMPQLNKIKIVLTGASGKPYKFESKLKSRRKATALLHTVGHKITRHCASAVYFSYRITSNTDVEIKYEIVSYGYVDDLNTLLRRNSIAIDDDAPVYVAYHKAVKSVCQAILYDIISAPGFIATEQSFYKI